MKRSITVILIALMLVSALMLTGCKGNSDSADATQAPSSAEQLAAKNEIGTPVVISAEEVRFTVDGKTVELNSEAKDALAALGEAESVTSQLSCHGEGEDKTYTYNGFILNTYPSKGVERVMEIVVNSSDYPTSKGVKVGDSVDAVTEAYGSDFKKVGAYYSYNAGSDMSLQFFIEKDTVTEIDYYYNAIEI